jgi:hypothetical protein
MYLHFQTNRQGAQVLRAVLWGIQSPDDVRGLGRQLGSYHVTSLSWQLLHPHKTLNVANTQSGR